MTTTIIITAHMEYGRLTTNHTKSPGPSLISYMVTKTIFYSGKDSLFSSVEGDILSTSFILIVTYCNPPGCQLF